MPEPLDIHTHRQTERREIETQQQQVQWNIRIFFQLYPQKRYFWKKKKKKKHAQNTQIIRDCALIISKKRLTCYPSSSSTDDGSSLTERAEDGEKIDSWNIIIIPSFNRPDWRTQTKKGDKSGRPQTILLERTRLSSLSCSSKRIVKGQKKKLSTEFENWNRNVMFGGSLKA